MQAFAGPVGPPSMVSRQTGTERRGVRHRMRRIAGLAGEWSRLTACD
jgi:hypothetical protein